MPRKLAVHFLPDLVAAAELACACVVVIDVLRASTTIVHALHAGADRVVPCVDIDEARRIAAELPRGDAVLGGERGGLPIEGFHLGNSPAEYTPDAVRNKTVVFTTTNGTRAMDRARQADQLLIGSFVNAAAIVDHLASHERVHLLCAGTGGQITREDVLAAGLMAVRLIDRGEGQVELANDEVRLAIEAWREASARCDEPGSESTDWLTQILRDSTGGRNLTRLGLAADIADAARLDRFHLVPRLDPKRWSIATV